MPFVEPSGPIRIQPPESEIPVPVAVVGTLARVPGAALTLTRIDAYRDGIMMHLRVDLLLEDGVEPQRESEIRRFLDSSSRSRPHRDDQIALSVTYPDGSRAEAMGAAPASLRALSVDEPREAWLTFRGGRWSGGSTRWTLEREAWLWPLPPAGILELHAASEPYGLPEGTVQIDGAELRRVAADAFDVAAR